MDDKARPPYVVFETRAIEDRGASLEAGHYVGKDVNYAIVTPSGSKDRIEKIAEEWLTGLEEAVNQERFPREWLEAYRSKYKTWVETREVPEDGTPILGWPALSPAQAQAILNCNVRTLEDLAVANEATLTAIGMGARSLKGKAKAWLETAEDTGKVAEEVDSLRKQVEALTETTKNDQEKIKTLQAKVKKLEKGEA